LGAAGASAVGLNDGALEVTADLGGRSTIDRSGDGVAGVGDNTGQLGGIGLCDIESSCGDDVKGTAGAQVVRSGDIERGLDGLACGDDLECFFIEPGYVDPKL